MIRLAGSQSRTIISSTLARSNIITKGDPLARPLSLTSARLDNNENEFRHSEDLAKERYDLRANEDIERKRARLVYQSKKRGMLENGVILSSFADKYLNSFDAEQLDQYDRLINLPTNDWDIFYWATKTKPTPPEFETAVMQKLRSHLNKKVSKNADAENLQDNHGADGDKRQRSEESGKQTKDSYLDGMRPGDPVLPATKTFYELDIDPSSVDLVNYQRELFDERTKKFRDGSSIVRMTEWRRRFFEKRLRRVISSPVSVRNLDDSIETPVYSQRGANNDIASAKLERNDLLDSERERSLKHHNFMQYLLNNEFTDNLDEYEWEAEAWSNSMWHRNYGKSDVTLAPSSIECSQCQVKLHCCDPGLNGYVPKELFAKLTLIENGLDPENNMDMLECQRCKFTRTYQASLDSQLDETGYVKMAKKFKNLEPSVICLVVDLTDFPSGVPEGLTDFLGRYNKLVIVGNKLDVLPIEGENIVERVTECLRSNLARLRPGNKNLLIHDIVVLSARTGFGVESLVSKLLELTENPHDVYLVGCANSGKSTLFNALLQSDLSASREIDLLSRVSREENVLGTGINMLKFPMSRPDGWQIELKKRRTVRVLRNTSVLERSLMNTTKIRQATVPHMSMLIDRLEYPIAQTAIEPTNSATSAIIHPKQEPTDVGAVKFSDDHPFQRIERRDLLSATKDNFQDHPFLYQTPSIVNKDQLHDLLTNEERLEVFPHETIVPRRYTLRPLQSLFIAGLARLDLLTATSYATVYMFASRYLPIHVVATRKADKFYENFLGSPYLGVPFGDSERLRAWPKLVSGSAEQTANGAQADFHIRRQADIVLSSAGWALVRVGPDQECIVRGWTPEGRGIFYRWPPLLVNGSKFERGKKIRDTPLFMHPHFSIDRVSVPADSRR